MRRKWEIETTLEEANDFVGSWRMWFYSSARRVLVLTTGRNLPHLPGYLIFERPEFLYLPFFLPECVRFGVADSGEGSTVSVTCYKGEAEVAVIRCNSVKLVWHTKETWLTWREAYVPVKR